MAGSRLRITHAQNDARYVEQGKHLFLQKDPDADEELKRMNHKKNGRPFKYPESTIVMIATIRYMCGLPYRMCEGLAIASLGMEDAPDHSSIHKRLKKVKVSIKDGITTAVSGNTVLRVIPDGTGMEPSTRGAWIRHKHKTKRGFIRVTMLVDQDTQEILAYTVTDEREGESKQFKRLMEDGLQNAGVDTEARREQVKRGEVPEQKIEVRSDGGNDTRENFSECAKLGVTPLIRVNTTSNAKAKGVDKSRATAVLDQLAGGASPQELAKLSKEEREANRAEWKKRVHYTIRWIVEIVISSFKRRMGSAAKAVKMENIIIEIGHKIMIHNRMLAVAREAIANA